MANFATNPVWTKGVRVIETSDPVVGGDDGVSNIAPRQLSARTDFLKKVFDKLLGVDSYHDENGTVNSEIILPVSAGGTGLNNVDKGKILCGTGNNTLEAISVYDLALKMNAISHYSEIPTTNVGPLIYVLGMGLMEWQTIGAFSGYASLLIGESVLSASRTPKKNQVLADGAALQKSKFPALWAWAGVNSHIVGASSWVKGSYKFVDLGGDYFRIPDLRGVFFRAVGPDPDNANALVSLGAHQGDAIRNIQGIFGRIVDAHPFSIYETEEYFGAWGGAFRGEDFQEKYRSIGNTAITDSAYQKYPHYYSFDASRVAPTAAENRPKSTSLNRYIYTK